MSNKRLGFTLIELLVVIAIIGVLAAILIPSLSKVQERALRAKVKTTVNQLAQATKAYEGDYGVYPPMVANGGATSVGGNYQYRNDVLMPFLDGDTNNGGPRIQYFEFQQQDCNGNIYLDHFGQAFWYCNFHGRTPTLTGKVIANPPLHPHYNAVYFRGIQIYTEANYEGDPYGGSTQTEDNFKWITNYTK